MVSLSHPRVVLSSGASLNIGRRLIHYSGAPLREIHSVPQGGSSGFLKPCGLWVSAEGKGDWPEWCENENYRIEYLKHQTEVILKAAAKILHIATLAEIRAFEAEYVTKSSGRRPESVAWNYVASQYQGIVISPYIWAHRLADTLWYYSWDCASGCIWDADAIKEFRAIAVHGEAA